MSLVVGVDIGNSTTEACVARLEVDPARRHGGVDAASVQVLGAGLAPTSGIKGSIENAPGVERAVKRALESAGCRLEQVDLVLVNEATPVISGLAMETITETVITESTMIGHNPGTPAGVGLGVGMSIDLADLLGHGLPAGVSEADPLVVLVPAEVDFDDAAEIIGQAMRSGRQVAAAVVQCDDANLIVNRLPTPIPVVDEVEHLDRVPRGMLSAVEVAAPGRSITTLSDTYGIASIFDLDPDATRAIAPVARALVGTRSAVVVRTPSGEVSERVIPAGSLHLTGERHTAQVGIDEGAEAVMGVVRRLSPLHDVRGDAGSHVGGMLARVRSTMARVSGQPEEQVAIRDVLALDTVVPQAVVGGLAGEVTQENAVALAAMVRTSRGPMDQLAHRLHERLGVTVRVGGVEADMAVLGALTTPGTARPVAVLDVGGGSTDAAFADESGRVRTVHVAGAGDLVTKLIDSELGLDDLEAAEHLKRHPAAKAESFFHLRLEDGSVTFLGGPLPAQAYARLVCLGDQGVVPIPTRHGLERVREVRRSAKRRVFVANAVRALEQVAPHGNLRLVDFVVVVGGSALDFEIPELIAAELARWGIVCGTGNVRGSEGPRNAVATGLVLALARERAESVAS